MRLPRKPRTGDKITVCTLHGDTKRVRIRACGNSEFVAAEEEPHPGWYRGYANTLDVNDYGRDWVFGWDTQEAKAFASACVLRAS